MVEVYFEVAVGPAEVGKGAREGKGRAGLVGGCLQAQFAEQTVWLAFKRLLRRVEGAWGVVLSSL